MIKMYLIYDNMRTNGTINVFICINNHVNSCIQCMLLASFTPDTNLLSPSSTK